MTQGHFRNEFGLNYELSADANPRNRGLVFGLPLGNFGLFASLLISFSAGFLAFFLTTFFGIFGILFYNSHGASRGRLCGGVQSYRVAGGDSGASRLFVVFWISLDPAQDLGEFTSLRFGAFITADNILHIPSP